MTGYTGKTKPKLEPLIQQIARQLSVIELSVKELAKLIPKVETLTGELSVMGERVGRAHNLLGPFANELEELRKARRTMEAALKLLDADVTILTGRPSSLPPAPPPEDK